MAETPVKHNTRKAARAALAIAHDEWEERVRKYASEQVHLWKLAARDRAAVAGPVFADLIDLHEPVVDDFAATPVRCKECFDHDEPYYDRDRAPWPCKTVKVLIQGFDLPSLPADLIEPQFEDFYEEPTVPVRFAHPSIDNAHNPGDTVNMKLSAALKYRGALDMASRERLHTLNQ